MRRLLLLVVLTSTFVQAQYTVKGTIQPTKKYRWALLYKIEGTKERFIENSEINNQLLTTNGTTLTIGTFEFQLPANAESGAYRITYDLKKNSYIDFLFNKEDVEFSFNPKDAESTIRYTKSKENQLYMQFLGDLSVAQYTIDSLQVAYLKAPSETVEASYKKAVEEIQEIQYAYNESSKGRLVHHFIKATDRYNAPTVAKNPQEYVQGIVEHFFDHIDFTNTHLYNSSFLVDRVKDYVFYMNYSQDPDQQQHYYLKATNSVIGKINDLPFKAAIIEFLITEFARSNNSALVDHLFANHYNTLPVEQQNAEFKKQINAAMAIAIGEIAPDFSWTENGNQVALSDLNDGTSYLLIFYSTSCPHCLREVPKVYELTKEKKNTKVIAFAMETSDKKWKKYVEDFKGWHHVLGLDKWDNKIAKTYQITSTPTYFVLGMDKRIIANPETLSELKVIVEELQ